MWFAEVTGDREALRWLAKVSDADLNLDVVEGKFWLSGPPFEDVEDPEQIRGLASDFLERMAGLLSIRLTRPVTLALGGLVEVSSSGQRHVLVPASGHLRLTDSFGVLKVSREDGSVHESTPATSLGALANVAVSSPSARKVLRLIQRPLDWVALFRIVEVIEEGMSGQMKLLCSANQLRRFKHSANSVSVAGDEARHGRESKEAPAKPMSLADARAFVMTLASAFIECIAGNEH